VQGNSTSSKSRMQRGTPSSTRPSTPTALADHSVGLADHRVGIDGRRDGLPSDLAGNAAPWAVRDAS